MVDMRDSLFKESPFSTSGPDKLGASVSEINQGIAKKVLSGSYTMLPLTPLAWIQTAIYIALHELSSVISVKVNHQRRGDAETSKSSERRQMDRKRNHPKEAMLEMTKFEAIIFYLCHKNRCILKWTLQDKTARSLKSKNFPTDSDVRTIFYHTRSKNLDTITRGNLLQAEYHYTHRGVAIKGISPAELPKCGKLSVSKLPKSFTSTLLPLLPASTPLANRSDDSIIYIPNRTSVPSPKPCTATLAPFSQRSSLRSLFLYHPVLNLLLSSPASVVKHPRCKLSLDILWTTSTMQHRFERYDCKSTTQVGILGLGLSISRLFTRY
jgi:hypothetical protein